ncbi:MAG: DMT family transporter [Chloroflexota bacterium]
MAVFGVFLLREYPTWQQWMGAFVFIAGALLFFYPFVIPTGQTIGYLVAAVVVLATSLSSIAGRGINRQATIHPLTVTLVSMGFGSIILLAAGLIVEPLPHLSLRSWAIILWLAVVNTALAFTLWNHTLRTLSAMESSVINNTMLIQIAILAWLFLDETLTRIEIIGLGLAALGAFLVQVRLGSRKTTEVEA